MLRGPSIASSWPIPATCSSSAIATSSAGPSPRRLPEAVGAGLRRAARPGLRQRPALCRDRRAVRAAPMHPSGPVDDASSTSSTSRSGRRRPVSGIFVLGADVTERARADHRCARARRAFARPCKAGRMGSWETDYPDDDGIWSAEGMALFGLDLPDGRGQVGGPDDEYVAALHPDDRHLAERYRELADQQDSFDAEYRIVRPDGTHAVAVGPRPGRGARRRRPGRSGWSASWPTPPRRKPAEERLRIEHERLGLALSAGRMGAYDMNIEDGVLWWSPRDLRAVRRQPRPLRPDARGVLSSFTPTIGEPFVRGRADAIARKPFVHEFRVLRPDGTQVWLGYRGQAEYDADRPAAAQTSASPWTSPTASRPKILRDAGRGEGQLHRHAVARAAQPARADPQRRESCAGSAPTRSESRAGATT